MVVCPTCPESSQLRAKNRLIGRRLTVQRCLTRASEERVWGDGWLRQDAAGSGAAAAVGTRGFLTFLGNACVLGEGTLFNPLLLKY